MPICLNCNRPLLLPHIHYGVYYVSQPTTPRPLPPPPKVDKPQAGR
jgi:hypothetical protein